MAIEYLGLSAINGPMVVLEGVSGAAYDEIVEMTVDGTKKKLGRIIEVYEDKAIIQVFEGTEGLGLKNVHTRLTGHPMELGVSEEMQMCIRDRSHHLARAAPIRVEVHQDSLVRLKNLCVKILGCKFLFHMLSPFS